jgi:hypothetical protein
MKRKVDPHKKSASISKSADMPNTTQLMGTLFKNRCVLGFFLQAASTMPHLLQEPMYFDIIALKERTTAALLNHLQ